MKYNTRHVVTAIVASYFFYYACTSTEWHFIDTVNLIFHEAGHTITFFFGQFISIASGSLFQILIPVICCLYFYQQEQKYSAALLLFWVGQNVINVSVYARDAIEMQLPLLGGDGVIHDWNYLLSALGMLKYTPYVADTLYAVGIIIFISALVFSVKFSKN
ncbi:hypothetical protein H7X65_02625 [Candidatus Parcubacteria bacterium]|nr:hypothetical protein [Candidatus Parcubacteria bacterium]